MHAREQAVVKREARVRARERSSSERQLAVIERERTVVLREQALRALAEADSARLERERLMLQMREANEKLVIATLRADELLERAVAAHAMAADGVTMEAERRRRAEAAASQLLANEQALRTSESEARARERAQDEFLAMLGHELRGPLAPILLALDLIRLDTTDAHMREHTIIDHQVKHLVRLVDDLLDLARVRSGKIALLREPIELADVVVRAVETSTPLIEAKGHALSVDVAERGLLVQADMLRLTQVVSNLLTNAAKYTPSGGTFDVRGERRGPSVQLHVRDNGIGISETMLPRIFDLYAQEQQRTDNAPGGLGIGLALVRSLMTLHGGRVMAHSEGLGRGSEFTIELPAVAGPSESIANPPAVVREPPVVARRLLIVDDNHLTADLIGLALRKRGHDVRVAFDGASALAAVGEFVPDIVLLDIGLPDMDGYHVAKRLREALSPRKPHFVALSGYGQAADRQRSMEAGFDDHLVKPVELAAIQRSIDRCMDTQK
jgi:signal transduction histidine kinase/ActR/RegA family two-component response regulator